MRRFILLASLPCLLGAETIKLAPKAYYNSLSPSNPVAVTVQTDDTVIVSLPDAAGYNEKGEKVASGVNPLVGPFYVQGAEPGDAVYVAVTRVKLNRNWGWSSYQLAAAALTPESAKSLYPNTYKDGAALPGRSDLLKWRIDVDRKTVALSDPPPKRFKLEFAAAPLLGCIGTTPPGDAGQPSTAAGSWGGAMYYSGVTDGARVTLPVYHRGGLIYIGVPRALQSDGAPVGGGIETSAEIQFEIGVVKNHPLHKITIPRIETRESMITVGSQTAYANSAERAIQMATTEMLDWLAQWGAEPWEAHMMIGFNGKYDVATVGGTVALKIPKSITVPPPLR